MIKYKNNNKNRWVDLSNLPQFKFNDEMRIQWDNSVGCYVPFQYDEVHDVMQIVGYRQQKTLKNKHRAILSITIGKYIPEPIEVRSDFITNCQLHNVVSNRIVNMAPELIQYLDDPDDAYKYSYQSNEKIWTRCPICGHRDLKFVNNLYKCGFVCHCISDGISIPNKIMFNILQQLGVDFISEVNKAYGFIWMGNYLYDFYFKLNDEPILIEMDGFFHQFQEDRDAIKTNLAIENGFKLIRIDCIYSNTDAVDFIKNKILESELSTLLPLDKVDWRQCRAVATTNLLMQVCDLWENSGLSIQQMVKKFCVNRTTIRHYLQQGYKIGLCPSYNEQEARYRSCLERTIPVAFIKNNHIQHVFSCAKEVEELSMKLFGVQCTRKGVQAVCNDEYYSHRDLNFKYITKEEYIQYKMINIEVVKGDDTYDIGSKNRVGKFRFTRI